MARNRTTPERAVSRKRAPALSIEDRENQMIAMAVDYSERLMLSGEAPTPIITHYLKLASTRELLEKEKLRKEIALLEAKKKAAESADRAEELSAAAIRAISVYGHSINHDDEDEY